MFISDNPLLDGSDAFELEDLTTVLSDACKETADLPLSIGILGDWGVGKTSLMRLIQKRVGASDVPTVWFNPWKHDGKEELWAAMLLEVLRTLHDGSDDSLKKEWRSLFGKTAWFVLKRAASVASAGVIADSDIEEAVQGISRQTWDRLRFQGSFESAFNQLLEKRLGPTGRIVIFVDDLDRCLPESGITVLEAMKTYLGNSKCVFVIGMDAQVVEEGVRLRYGASSKVSGREYLEKLIQIPVRVPSPPRSELTKAIGEQVLRASAGQEIWNLALSTLGNNPRRLKRFANSFLLLQRLANLSPPATSNQVLSREQHNYLTAKLMLLQIEFPEFFSLILRSPESLRTLEKRFVGANADAVASALKEFPELSDHWRPKLSEFLRVAGSASSLHIDFTENHHDTFRRLTIFPNI